MKILVNNQWRDGFLDYYKGASEYRIQVLALANLEKLEGAYFVRPKNLRFIWNYLLEVGILAVWRKIKSRLQEAYRNEKYISCGLGKIIESTVENYFTKDKIVGFIAPFHPPLVERLVLPKELIFEVDNSIISSLTEDTIFYWPVQSFKQQKQDWWESVKGWSIYSGKEISVNNRETISRIAREFFQTIDWSAAQTFSLKPHSQIAEFKEFPSSGKSLQKKRGVVFGYGHYAKTNILPNVKKDIAIEAIHEIDPTQIVFNQKIKRWDTAPLARLSEKYDVYFIASFHHTHAPLAIQALKQDSYAVVEKPIVTTEAQLEQLLETLARSHGQFFSGFHRRYSIFNEWIKKDLEIENSGQPIAYHCIVYEVPQPPLYWYNWPVSGSPLLANGCHWIDHFLYLNNFMPPKNWEVFVGKDGTINAVVELENSACFTMTLTASGSPYIGFRDYVELTATDKSVQIINYANYLAQNKQGVIRKARVNKLTHYANMYRLISRKISEGQAGDSLDSIQRSAGLILTLEKAVQAQRH